MKIVRVRITSNNLYFTFSLGFRFEPVTGTAKNCRVLLSRIETIISIASLDYFRGRIIHSNKHTFAFLCRRPPFDPFSNCTGERARAFSSGKAFHPEKRNCSMEVFPGSLNALSATCVVAKK